MSRIFSWRGYNNLTLSLVSKGVKLSKRGFFFLLEQDAAITFYFMFAFIEAVSKRCSLKYFLLYIFGKKS